MAQLDLPLVTADLPGGPIYPRDVCALYRLILCPRGAFCANGAGKVRSRKGAVGECGGEEAENVPRNRPRIAFHGCGGGVGAARTQAADIRRPGVNVLDWLLRLFRDPNADRRPRLGRRPGKTAT